jgi:hypothetical protein
MPNDPAERPFLQLHIPNHASAVAAIMCLGATLQLSVEMFVFSEGTKIEDKRARTEMLIQKLLSEAKSQITEPMSEKDELTGMEIALAIIRETRERVIDKL